MMKNDSTTFWIRKDAHWTEPMAKDQDDSNQQNDCRETQNSEQEEGRRGTNERRKREVAGRHTL
jgi:hypothetical protein